MLTVITSVYNEGDLLPQFTRHYRRQGATKIIILDNWSTDGSVDEARTDGLVTVMTYGDKTQLDDINKRDTLMQARKMLGHKSEYVVLVDCDEFIVPSRSDCRLVDMRHAPYFKVCGYQMLDKGDPYDPSVPLTEQRKYGYHDPNYSKQVFTRADFDEDWGAGMHDCKHQDNAVKPCEADAYLLHYSAFDRDIAIRRRRRQCDRTREINQSRGHGAWRPEMTDAELELWYVSMNAQPWTKIIP